MDGVVYGIFYEDYEETRLETVFTKEEDANKWLKHILSSWGCHHGPLLERERIKYKMKKIEIFESFDNAIQTYKQ